MTIVCDRNVISVEVNGQLVTRMNLDEWTTANRSPRRPGSQSLTSPTKIILATGFIGLQDHGKPMFLQEYQIT